MSPGMVSPGIYYVAGSIPTIWEGRYDLIWYLKQFPNSNQEQIVEEFEVVRVDPARSSFEAPSVLFTSQPGLNPILANLIMTVRELLSDENPDRNYHFRPPTSGSVVAGFNDRVGFIWTDKTIIRMLRLATAKLNTWNPMAQTNYTPETAPADWGQCICVGAAAMCLGKEAARWSAEGMSYSLNGVSLDLNKASEYQSLGQEYEQEFQTWAPLITANRPASVGLRQQRWLL